MAQQLINPFKPAVRLDKRVKLLVYGEPGAGKTTLALQLQRLTGGKVAMIDTEGGADLYAGADGMPAFDVLRTKTYTEIIKALEFIATGQHDYNLLVIDPITVIWNVIIEGVQLLREKAVERNGKDPDTASLTIKDWGVIKRKMNKIYNMLVNLPVNVVVTAREKEEYEGEGDHRKKVGSKPDAEKSLDYLFDGIIHLTRDGKGVRVAMVKKDRSGQLPPRIEGMTPDSLKPLFATRPEGTGYTLPSESEAAAALADELEKEEQQTKPAPQPTQPTGGEQTTQPQANGKVTPMIPQKATRPLQPVQIYDMLRRKADTRKNQASITLSQQKMIRLRLENEHGFSETERHYLLDQTWKEKSTTKLLQNRLEALIEWLDSDPAMVKQEVDLVKADFQTYLENAGKAITQDEINESEQFHAMDAEKQAALAQEGA